MKAVKKEEFESIFGQRARPVPGSGPSSETTATVQRELSGIKKEESGTGEHDSPTPSAGDVIGHETKPSTSKNEQPENLQTKDKEKDKRHRKRGPRARDIARAENRTNFKSKAAKQRHNQRTKARQERMQQEDSNK